MKSKPPGPVTDVVSVETYVVNPVVLRAATNAVVQVMNGEGMYCSLRVAEDIAFQAIKAAHAARKRLGV